jgi:hypothetical protein
MGRRAGSALLITRDRAGGPDGRMEAFPLLINSLEIDTLAMTTTVEADDWSGALRDAPNLTPAGSPGYGGSSEEERVKGGFWGTGTAALCEGQRIF